MKNYKALIVMMLGMLLGWAMAFGQVVNFKLGVQDGNFLYTYPVISIESRIGERLTFQPEFGFFRKAQKIRELQTATNQVHFGLDGRIYLFLRQEKYFCGLYAGVFVSHDRLPWLIEGYPKSVVKRYATSTCLSLGYQQSFLKHFQVDGGLRVGYRKGITEERYNAAGGLVTHEVRNHHWVDYLYLQVGYAF